MSYLEYRDMFYKAQEDKSPYVMFTIDIIDSKKMSVTDRADAQSQLIALHLAVSHKSADFNTDLTTLFGAVSMPQRLGDACGWWTKKENENQLLASIKQTLKTTNLRVRISKGYFETTEYCCGHYLYYGGYCFSELTNAHKDNGCGEQYIVDYYPEIG